MRHEIPAKTAVQQAIRHQRLIIALNPSPLDGYRAGNHALTGTGLR